MMKIKQGVRLKNLKPQMSIAAVICNSVFDDYGYDLIITSGSDGKHSTGSLHYFGEALDLRKRHIAEDHLVPIVNALKSALGSEFDVVLESTHIHVEYDPKH